MKQIIVIHGGNPFDSYDAYLRHLKTKTVWPEKMRGGDWKSTLKERLGENFDVLLAEMPCKENAKYLEWKIWFERLIPLFEEEVVFVGHSLGGIFLAKWLSENEYPKKIRAVFLVASPFAVSGDDQRKNDFMLPANLGLFEKQAGAIHVYHSKDDPVVKFSEAIRYRESLPNARLREFDGFKHFNQKEFPEIVEELRGSF